MANCTEAEKSGTLLSGKCRWAVARFGDDGLQCRRIQRAAGNVDLVLGDICLDLGVGIHCLNGSGDGLDSMLAAHVGDGNCGCGHGIPLRKRGRGLLADAAQVLPVCGGRRQVQLCGVVSVSVSVTAARASMCADSGSESIR